jgi:hypothetical protein
MSARIALVALITLAFLPRAEAQTTPTTPTGVAFAKEDFQIRLERKDDKGNFIFPTAIEAQYFFNKARCECDESVALRVDMTASGVAKQRMLNLDGTVLLYSGGSNCVEASSADRPPNMNGCTLLATLPTLNELAKTYHQVETTVGKLFASGMPPANKGCAARFTQSVWLWVDSDSGGNPDMGVSGTNAPGLPIDYDGEAPAPPMNVKAVAGNEALNVSWTRATVASDQNGSLVFCSRAGLPVFNPSYFSQNEYQSQKTVCPKKTIAAPANEPDSFERLDPKFLCSDLLTTSSEWRLKGLQNGILYQVGVAAVDLHGNASPIETVLVQAPVPTVDFFDAYRAAGGQASGCSFGGRTPAGGAALLLLALALIRRRR